MEREAPDLNEVEVEGYERCPCGALELRATYYQCKGVCFECFRKGDLAHLTHIETINRARRVDIPIPSPWPKKKKLKRNRNRARPADKARVHALRRLRALYPDMYDLLYTEERVKMGLEPTPKRIAGHLKQAVETYEAEHGYSPEVTGAVDATRQEDAQGDPV